MSQHLALNNPFLFSFSPSPVTTAEHDVSALQILSRGFENRELITAPRQRIAAADLVWQAKADDAVLRNLGASIGSDLHAKRFSSWAQMRGTIKQLACGTTKADGYLQAMRHVPGRFQDGLVLLKKYERTKHWLDEDELRSKALVVLFQGMERGRPLNAKQLASALRVKSDVAVALLADFSGVSELVEQERVNLLSTITSEPGHVRAPYAALRYGLSQAGLRLLRDLNLLKSDSAQVLDSHLSARPMTWRMRGEIANALYGAPLSRSLARARVVRRIGEEMPFQRWSDLYGYSNAIFALANSSSDENYGYFLGVADLMSGYAGAVLAGQRKASS